MAAHRARTEGAAELPQPPVAEDQLRGEAVGRDPAAGIAEPALVYLFGRAGNVAAAALRRRLGALADIDRYGFDRRQETGYKTSTHVAVGLTQFCTYVAVSKAVIYAFG